MAKSIAIQIKGIVDRMKKATTSAITPAQIRPIILNAIDLIVKRTRLGYGVDRSYGTKKRLPPLSPMYVNFRRKFKKLSTTTSAKRSNVTLTGELLESVGIKRISKGVSVISAIGKHAGGISNEDLTSYLHRQNRTFLRISELEYKQLVRIYRKTFGDLLRRERLIR